MRIAHFVWALNLGGIQTMLVDIVNEQVKSHEVAIFIVNNIVDNLLIDKLDKRILIVYCNRNPGSKNILPIAKLNWKLHAFHPDIIHIHEDKLTGLLINNRIPLVRTIHNTHSNPSEYNKFSTLCCISKSVKKYTESQGFPRGIVIYNGIHTKDIPVRTKPINFKDNMVKIVCVGRLHPMKGQQLLIEAAYKLICERNHNNINIDFIGDGGLRKELESLANGYHLQNYIQFLGSLSREQFYPDLKNYDLFVLPSLSEGFGLSLAEACAAKLPVLTCDLPGPMEVIADGKYGKSFKAGNAQSLADEIEKIISFGANVEQVNKAYQYVTTHFDVTVTTQQYIEIYNKLV